MKKFKKALRFIIRLIILAPISLSIIIMIIDFSGHIVLHDEMFRAIVIIINSLIAGVLSITTFLITIGSLRSAGNIILDIFRWVFKDME